MNKKLAKVFYEMCAGSHSGHMANIPNNPVIYSILRAMSEGRDDQCYAMSLSEFAITLRDMADAIESRES